MSGSGSYDFVLMGGASADGVQFASREAASFQPELVVKTMPPPSGTDTTRPATTISSSPSGVRRSRLGIFTFYSSEKGSSFECRLDGGDFEPCVSPKGYGGLADGSHTVEVRAVDLAGNRDLTPSTRTWTVDLTPPQTFLDSGPSGTATSTTAEFLFHANEAVRGFACSLDGGAFVPCTSPKEYTGLTSTSHTFKVRATDVAGNVDPTSAIRSWTVAAP
jgi:hypothetical protein